MSDIRMQIDGQEVSAEPGMTVLEAAQAAGISIPTLCHHHKLKPYGGCRLCMVEVASNNRTKLVVSCVYEAAQDLVVKTNSAKIQKIRKTILELLLARAPDSEILKRYAEEYGADAKRFEKEASFCVHCGLCVRYCSEIKKLDAVGFVDRGYRKEIRFVPEIASSVCNDCKECFPLCPTSYLQAAFVLSQSLSSVSNVSASE